MNNTINLKGLFSKKNQKKNKFLNFEKMQIARFAVTLIIGFYIVIGIKSQQKQKNQAKIEELEKAIEKLEHEYREKMDNHRDKVENLEEVYTFAKQNKKGIIGYESLYREAQAEEKRLAEEKLKINKLKEELAQLKHVEKDKISISESSWNLESPEFSDDFAIDDVNNWSFEKPNYDENLLAFDF